MSVATRSINSPALQASLEPVAVRIARATVIGAPQRMASGDAAFADAVMGHSLEREDMHSGSISQLGIVVLPT